MKSIGYTEGPPTLSAGIAGRFVLGEPKDVEDDIAELLLAKPMFTEFNKKKKKEEVIEHA